MRKAVIPAAGLGTRFLPATKAQPKEMLPVVDKPAIQYVVEEAVAAGINDILVITGRGKRSLEDHFDRVPELEYELAQAGNSQALAQVRALTDLANLHYVRQGEPLGLGHAVGVARQHVGEQPFAVLLGDDLMVDEGALLSGMISTYDERHGSVIALKEVPRDEISAYGSAEIETIAGERNLVRIRRIVEKPEAEVAPSNFAATGRYVLSPAIFGAIDRVKPGHGGEIQLTDAIDLLAAEEPVFGYIYTEGRYDVGKKIEYLKATIELACARPDLGPELLAFLRTFVAAQD